MNGDANQLAFGDMEIRQQQEKARALTSALDRAAKSAALSVKRDRLATVADVSYSYLSEILNTNGGEGAKPFPMRLLPAVALEARHAFAGEVINLLCDICGYEHPEPTRVITAEEEVILLRRKLATIEQAVAR